MPQADEELRSIMVDWFGSMEDYGPTKLLESHGFVLTREWKWIKPVPSHTLNEIEWTCLQFLIDEWDFGGLHRIGE